ncbi:hypothetical protein [Bacillus sp. 1P06AnD]|uniref:hypothetical protein n=1 Tax=Bacillus sp. 1P06AnD TaxID=3132208 RepID=UPI0039A35257
MNIEKQLLEDCKTHTSFEMLGKATNGHIRGLDMVTFQLLRNRNQLPPEVVNVLIVYFFHEFANKVYDRNDLVRLYTHWVSKNVQTINQAIDLSKLDITETLSGLKNR